ncbi:patatin-like phospholipase family protein [Ruminiclostridium herbifermentans]|uniref:Patatin-like phospholipase family protein n=1 Tax=Ruminiclostridium herbifermentans TaxID=2488810 RepID=A0A4U7JL82_9FIRM|nr:CBASS cGAMP-activated phospholipase [Ruminiclostridium herbifermentans]QNU68379.1 patatin-like phospholipase family protein [Ruminiclostridium herbifermentans]
MNKAKILSIDGGGIRGIIPAMVLAEIEKMTSKPICKLFDFISGTSTGGIITLCLTKPSNNNQDLPEYSAQDIVNLYVENGKKIFSSDILHRIISFNGLFDEKYSSDGIESLLKKYLGTSKLSECLTRVLIPSYEIELRRPFFFKSWLAKSKNDKKHNFYMWQVARATSAAPTYFEPFKLEIDKDTNEYYSFIDGGVFANNPAMCAFADAKVIYKNIEDILIVSLGTGEFTKSIPHDKAKDWGLAKWAKPILDTIFDGESDTVNYQLRQLLKPNNYYRIQASLEQLGKDEIDDASDKNIHELILLGKSLIEDWQRNGYLDRLCYKLI